MQALTARGNSAEALLVYDQLVQRLRDELGVPPSAETRVLHASILRTPPRRASRMVGELFLRLWCRNSGIAAGARQTHPLRNRIAVLPVYI